MKRYIKLFEEFEPLSPEKELELETLIQQKNDLAGLKEIGILSPEKYTELHYLLSAKVQSLTREINALFHHILNQAQLGILSPEEYSAKVQPLKSYLTKISDNF